MTTDDYQTNHFGTMENAYNISSSNELSSSVLVLGERTKSTSKVLAQPHEETDEVKQANKFFTLVQLTSLVSSLPRNIRHLSLNNCSLTDDSLKVLGRLGGLEKLSLQRNAIHGEGLHYLTSLTTQGLVELFLDDNLIDDKNAASLVALFREGSKLQGFYVSGNSFSGKGATFLAQAMKNSSLMILCVSGCKIGNDGALKLVSATQKPCSLMVLNMDECDVDDQILPRIGSFFDKRQSSLSKLRMRGNKFALDEPVLEGMLTRVLHVEEVDVSDQRSSEDVENSTYFRQ
jgi:hypothetical protein